MDVYTKGSVEHDRLKNALTEHEIKCKRYRIPRLDCKNLDRESIERLKSAFSIDALDFDSEENRTLLDAQIQIVKGSYRPNGKGCAFSG